MQMLACMHAAIHIGMHAVTKSKACRLLSLLHSSICHIMCVECVYFYTHISTRTSPSVSVYMHEAA